MSQPIGALSSAPSPYSAIVPNLQIALDSTSIGEFKTCPRKYQYSIMMGLIPAGEQVHLKFGILMHKAREGYDKARCTGAEHEEALLAVVADAMTATWEGNGPWNSGHSEKNRLSLLRAIVWYLDHYGQNDNCKTLVLRNGAPAVELSFRFESGLRSPLSGEEILLCGHLDRAAELNGDVYILDLKTTTRALNPSWFDGFTPDNQFSLYTLAGQVVLGQKVQSLIVDGIQVGATFVRFQRGLVHRSPEQIREWYNDLRTVVRTMANCAEDQYWPMNDKSCGNYGGCPYRRVCSMSPEARPGILQGFAKRLWNPLETRD